MDYKLKLYELLSISRKVKNKNKIYKDIEETITKIPNFTEPYFNLFMMCDRPAPLVEAILMKCDAEIVKLLYSYYHKEDIIYEISHSCYMCDKYLDYSNVRGNLEFILNESYYNNCKYIKELANLFQINLIENEEEKHRYILNNGNKNNINTMQ